MQVSEAWLRDFVDPPVGTGELVAQLTMAGLEVDSVQPAAAIFNNVVVGEVLTLAPHPDADRLKVCQISVGGETLQIVCGAGNVRAGLKVPAALIGAQLPGDFKIRKSKLRGVESFGMLCSAQELGLAHESDGLLELPPDAPAGADIRDYLALNDTLLEVDLTPNRADCLSVEGIAREVAALNGMPWRKVAAPLNPVGHRDEIAVNLEAGAACPRYLGRLIKDVNGAAETPVWMKERLRRSGIRSLGPLVDITNYVLMELGQPLHAFDAARIKGGISVRQAGAGEKLTLLNGQTLSLDQDMLVIADDERPLALAGIMGGSESAVDHGSTRAVFLECAFFAPRLLAGKARRYGLHTDSSHRFERGVDAALQERAIERATRLILEICGGTAGPVTLKEAPDAVPRRNPIRLNRRKLARLLGIALADEAVADIFRRLEMQVDDEADGWSVTPPSFRFDIAIEADLIEEVARIYGYNNLPTARLWMRPELTPAPEGALSLDRLKDLLVDRGYQEAITYSFVDEALQNRIAPGDRVMRLQNPISADLAVMRSTLWSGLLTAALHNLNHQHTRIRLFEAGLRFLFESGEIRQQKMLAGLAIGSVFEEHWSEKQRPVDFFDVKGDVEALLGLAGDGLKARFIASPHSALHPGQSAQITTGDGVHLGWLGMLHPLLEKQLGFAGRVFLFELDQGGILRKAKPAFRPLSKFPSVRRDLALIVDEKTKVDTIMACIEKCAEPSLQKALLFDVYQGPGVEQGKKSVALGLVIQDFSQTLTDSEIDAIVNRVLAGLTDSIDAKLRD